MKASFENIGSIEKHYERECKNHLATINFDLRRGQQHPVSQLRH